MVLWLASDDSRMCTAQLWVVDAGGCERASVTYDAVLAPLPARPQHGRRHACAALYRQRACARARWSLAIATLDWRWLIAAPLIGYAFAWTAHYAIEGNRPETFGHPFWSLFSDYRMLLLALTFRLAPHLHRAGVR